MQKKLTPFVENVLLIDDEEIDNLINERLLQASYFAQNVTVKTNIPTAISYLYKAIEAGKGIPDIIFLDLHLPQYDGFHFMLEFKELQYKYEELQNTSIVILSAHIAKYPKHILAAHSFIQATLNKPLAESALQTLQEKIKATVEVV